LTDNQRLSRSNRPLVDPGPAACFRGPDHPSALRRSHAADHRCRRWGALRRAPPRG
jgi:hypothetical protein